jgi:CRP/FNR family transcriptional regulator, cyclic AMP receptor protein
MRLFTQDTKVDALKRAPLFEGLLKKELVELARRAEDLEAPSGTVLCKEGDVGREFFVLMDGTVVVTAKEKRIATLGAGDFIGEIALLEQVPRMATVTATTPVRFFVLSREDFRHLVRQHPDVESKILRTLALRLVELSRDPTVA